MIRLALNSVAAHRLRLALTALSITLGVAFVAGAFVFTDTISARFETLFDEVYAGIDVTVRPQQPEFGSGPGPTGETMPDDVLAAVATVDGVATVAGSVGGFAQLVAADGTPIGGQGPPTLGGSWIAQSALSPLHIADGNGRPPAGPGEVVVDAGTADGNDFALGDTIEVETAAGTTRHELVGIANFGSEDNLAGATMALFDLDQAQALLGMEGRLSTIDVVAADGVDVVDLMAGIERVLPADVEVVTGDQQVGEQLDDFAAGLGFLSTALLAFAGVAILVAAFVIHNTFRIVVAQRVRELALLRALGATGRQVVGMVMVEASVVATLASGLGVAAGIGVATAIKAAMEAGGIGVPDGPLTIAPRTVVVAMAVGIVVTLVSALLPARRAASVAPVAAMSVGLAPSEPTGLRHRTVVGLGLLAVGGVLVAAGLVVTDAPVALVAVGSVLAFVAVIVLAPVVAVPLASLLGRPLRGVPGRLARDNSVREPRRTAATATALMVGVALVTFVAVLASSIQGSVAQTLRAAFPADLAFQSTNITAGVSPEVERMLDDVDEVAVASSVRLGQVRVDEEVVGAVSLDDDVDAVYDLGATVAPAQIGDGMLVAEDLARTRGWAIGDVVDVEFAATGSRGTEVVGTFTDTTFAPIAVASNGAGGDGNVDAVALVLTRLRDGVSLDDGAAAAAPVLEAFPSLDMNTREEQVAQAQAQVDGLLALFTGLLALAVVIAVLGIANTLSLSVVERVRELGLLRAVGFTRRQVRRMVRGEAIIVALFGTVLGLVVGFDLGWVAVAALSDLGVGVFGVPWSQLLALIALAVVAGLVAAIGPARRASRMDVLSALAHE